MKLQTFYQNAFYLLVGSIVGFFIATALFYKSERTINCSCPTEKIEDTIKNNSVLSLYNNSFSVKPDFLKSKSNIKSKKPSALNDSILMKELLRQEIKYPKIVLAQAKLETGHYTSKVYKRHNNLFGLRHSKGYYKFNTWPESVTAYKNFVQYKYKGGSYLAFLEKIGYAEDPNYTKCLKALM